MTAAARARLLALVEQIREWQADDKQGYDTAIELLCEAGDELETLAALLPPVEESSLVAVTARAAAEDNWADVAEALWGLVANARWDERSQEWQDAAAKARNRYTALCAALLPPVEEPLKPNADFKQVKDWIK